MKFLTKENYYYFIGATIIIVLLFVVLGGEKSDNSDLSVSPTVSPETKPLPTPTPKPEVMLETAKPTPGIIAQEVPSYEALAKAFDEENRYFYLDENCTNIFPSNVVHKNGVQIMLDNGLSSEARVIKIGDRQYSLNAGEWILANLSSDTLPVHLPIYCGSLELGDIQLVK